jgi:hypothetical protein
MGGDFAEVRARAGVRDVPVAVQEMNSTSHDDEADLRRRWAALWARLRVPPESVPSINPLISAYRSPSRHYHNLTHIRSCLDELSYVSTLCSNLDAVELAKMTRMRAARDILIVTDLPADRSEPQEDGGVIAKVGYDATMKPGDRREGFDKALPPPDSYERMRKLLLRVKPEMLI